MNLKTAMSLLGGGLLLSLCTACSAYRSNVAAPAPLASVAAMAPATASTQVTHDTIEVDGVEVFYREAGPKDAPTILLLHGFKSCHHVWKIAHHAGFLKPLQSLGYRHLCDHVIDALPLEEAVRRTQRDTRRFARKQRTWMRGLGFKRVEQEAEAKAMQLAAAVFAR